MTGISEAKSWWSLHKNGDALLSPPHLSSLERTLVSVASSSECIRVCSSCMHVTNRSFICQETPPFTCMCLSDHVTSFVYIVANVNMYRNVHKYCLLYSLFLFSIPWMMMRRHVENYIGWDLSKRNEFVQLNVVCMRATHTPEKWSF